MEVKVQAKAADVERIVAKFKAQFERMGKQVIVKVVRKGSNG